MNSVRSSPRYAKRLAQRHAAERRFRLAGLGAVVVSLSFLAILLATILHDGLSRHQLGLPHRALIRRSPRPRACSARSRDRC